MWKTRFEVNTNIGHDLTRHRALSCSTEAMHYYNSWSLPTVTRTREDSPNANNRPSPSLSIANLGILSEEDEDIACTNIINDHQTSFKSAAIRRKSSYQIINRYQTQLPTIIESNDHESINDNMSKHIDLAIATDRSNKYAVTTTPIDSFMGTNTNYNQVVNVDIDRKELTLNTNMNPDAAEFTLDKQIQEFLQEKSDRLNKVCEIVLVFATSNF